MIGLWLLVAIALDRAQLQIGAFSYNSPWNGLGTVDNVNQRAASAPMAYRVLMPWLINLIERVIPPLKKHRLTVYEWLKIGGMTFALSAIERALGLNRALLVAALLPITFLFDYWDWPIELGALALALSGSLGGALVGGLLLSLARETAPLVALTYGLVSGDWGGAVGVGLLIALVICMVRQIVGYRPLYCDRFMVIRNWAELRGCWHGEPFPMDFTVMSAGLTMLTCAAVVSGRAGSAWPVPLLVLGLGWTMGVARETRIFTPVLLWIAMGLL